MSKQTTWDNFAIGLFKTLHLNTDLEAQEKIMQKWTHSNIRDSREALERFIEAEVKKL